jgi:hypothetical protein
VAKYETYREGEGVTPMTFTIEEAQAAGVAGKDNWRKYPKAMLRARCIAALARTVYPDLLAGVYETEELETAPRHAAPVIEAPAQPEAVIDAVFKVEEEETDDEKIARWSDAIAACSSVEKLATLSKEIRKESLSDDAKQAVNAAYKARKRELTEAPKERQAGEEG